MLPFITALCPTYRRPELLANSLALWEMQMYPADRRRLVILDDGGTFDTQSGRGWALISMAYRAPSLPAKYNALLEMASVSDAFLVWEDDDVYLPSYVALHAAALTEHELSKPAKVLSDYPGYLVPEPAAGRFHSTLGFRRELIERVGGWPDTKRADFDQQFIQSLQNAAESTGDPFACLADPELPFVYGWHTGHLHGQSTMRSPEDADWYDRYSLPPIHAGQLRPRLDDRTQRILNWSVGRCPSGIADCPFDHGERTLGRIQYEA